MNRFNLFFVFLTTLVSSALQYSIRGEENVKQEMKSLIHTTAPDRHGGISKSEIEDEKTTEAASGCEFAESMIIYL